MQSKWLDKRLNAKDNMKENILMIYLSIIYLIIGGVLFIISIINSAPHGACRVIGYIFLILCLFLIVFYFLKSFIITKKMVISSLKNKNFTQKDLDLLDEEMNNNNYKEISVGGKIIVTDNFLIKDSYIRNKVDIFKITNLHKITYWDSGFHIALDKEFPADKTNGLIEFYNKNEENIFSFNLLRESCQKILDYFIENRKDISVEIMKK